MAKPRVPAETPERQPVHVVYGGAHLFKAETARKLGDAALKALDEHAPDGEALAECLGIASGAIADTVRERVVDKLSREPVEDFRIDFEDGYGNRPAAEEDGHAESAAREVAKGLAAGTLPPFIGIRVKALSGAVGARAARTLELFLTTLARETRGRLPENFTVTLPKVVGRAEPKALAALLDRLERRLRLERGAVKCELMVETPQAIVGPDGACPLPRLVQAFGGRCVAAHFGAYDYTASLGITAGHQRMGHPACDFAKHMMQTALAPTSVRLSDGATTLLPVGGRDGVRRAWRLSYADIRHSLAGGFYQGWDLHPHQLPVRYAALFAFFLEGAEAASARLRSFMERAAQATLLGGVFDDAATGQGLLNYFLRGLACGAITPAEAQEAGLSPSELRTRSFLKILDGRRGAAGPAGRGA
ncbi:MAG: phosphoenolpyruvate kinase [Elusimicrobia bacterium]|nr:phosphoenolpyruvate kinase [Elusimicrobiota bacterium]